MNIDVVIAGAGIAGTAAAALLGQAGFSVIVVDPGSVSAEPPPIADEVIDVDPRVSAISPASQSVLEQVGAWALIPDAVRSAYSRMTVWERDGTGQIHFDAADTSEQRLGHIIENRWLTYALAQSVSTLANVELCMNDSVASFAWDADASRMNICLASKRQLNAALLIGADGARSFIRSTAGIGVSEVDTGQTGIVSTVKCELSHQRTAWQNFLPTGPLAFLPLASDGVSKLCSIVWSAENSLAEELMGLNDTDFCNQVGAALEHRMGEVVAASTRYAFPLRQLHAHTYHGPGLALVGDAAHVIHPLAGQGINLGLADVRVLAEELRRGCKRGLSLSDSGVLARYQRRRKGENELMLRAMTGFRVLFGSNNPGVRLLRNFGVQTVNDIKPLKLQFMRHAMGM